MTRPELIEHLVRSARRAHSEYVTVRVVDLLAALADQPEPLERPESPKQPPVPRGRLTQSAENNSNRENVP